MSDKVAFSLQRTSQVPVWHEVCRLAQPSVSTFPQIWVASPSR